MTGYSSRSARWMQVQFWNDFTGGLNNRSQRQQLAKNETPDCLDVVFNNRGGFGTRRGFTVGLSDATNLSGGYIGGQFSAGSDVLWGFNTAGNFWTWQGSGALSVTTPTFVPVVTSRVTSAVWNSKLYFANWFNTAGGVYKMYSWNGSAFTLLTNTSNNNYTAPTSGNAPLAKYVASHSGHMFWADTVESGVRYRSRVRWSHPLQPECFADADYFDIEPDDQTNQITALVPFRNMLLVFKQRGVFAIFGYDKDTFTVERISTQAGAAFQTAVCSTAGAVYWWSPDGNVYAYNGSSVVPIGDRISQPAIDGTISLSSTENLAVWADNMLYVILKTNSGSRLCYVYDPQVGRDGAWTQFSFAPTSMIWWRSPSKTGMYFTMNGYTALFDKSNLSQQFDDYTGVGGAVTPIQAYYRTAWFSSYDAGLTKRWRRPHVTVACGDDANLHIDVYHDFQESVPLKQLVLPITNVATGAMTWYDGVTLTNSTWGTNWYSTDPGYEFKRVSSLGRSHAVQMKVYMKDHTTMWWVDSITMPYFNKAYR